VPLADLDVASTQSVDHLEPSPDSLTSLCMLELQIAGQKFTGLSWGGLCSKALPGISAISNQLYSESQKHKFSSK
jgi:hypothetical protein